jgi:CubicO group peptidase (beta-lactamase class C family)
MAGLGRLDLDGDVNRYLDFEIPATFDAPITVRHLLTHTPGRRKTSAVCSPATRRPSCRSAPG